MNRDVLFNWEPKSLADLNRKVEIFNKSWRLQFAQWYNKQLIRGCFFKIKQIEGFIGFGFRVNENDYQRIYSFRKILKHFFFILNVCNRTTRQVYSWTNKRK